MLLPFLTILLLIRGGFTDSHFDPFDRVCNELVRYYHCDDFVQKTLCGSDGNNYNSECDFAKAHCQHRHLSIVHDGPCQNPTTVTTTAAPTTAIHTAAATPLKTTATTTEVPKTVTETTAMPTTAPTSTDVTGDMTTAFNTHKDVITTTMPMTATTVMTTTMPAITKILSTITTTAGTTLDAFKCQILIAASCPTGGDKVCGTDSKTYANTCEFQKQKCKTPTLNVAQKGACNTFSILCNVIVARDCPLSLDPVCGTNGHTYSSLCEEEKAKCTTDPNLQIAHNGQCTKVT